jgi:hypothetical protein
MKTIILRVVLCSVLCATGAISFADDAQRIVGSWSGNSICTGSLPACTNEKVIYVIETLTSSGHVTGHADKIVNGERIVMGEFNMLFDAKTSTITWEIPRGLWKYSVKGNQIDGTLTLKSGEVVRHVTLTKDKT